MQVNCVWENNNNKLGGLRAQFIVHTIKRLEEQIQRDVYVGKLIYVGNEHSDYYMMSLQQKITSIEKFTSLGKLSAQFCRDPGFQIINGIQSYGDHVMDEGECVVKRQQPRREKESYWITDQPW